MSTLGSIIFALGNIVHSLIFIYMWVIIINALLSFVRVDPSNQIIQILHRLSDPAHQLIRRVMPTSFNGIDLAPLIIVVILQIIDVVFTKVLFSLAQTI